MLDNASCSLGGATTYPDCGDYPTSNATVQDVWARLDPESQAIDLWVVGGWPVYEEGFARDIRASLYYTNLKLSGL